MADVAQKIAHDLKSALESDALDLPSLPEVALRIRDEAESEFVSATTLGKVVSEDPGLAAQLVRTANSPMFRATRTIDDVSQAISRLGVDFAANVATGLAMQQMFQATSELVDRKLREVWKHSCHVAAYSAVICNQYTKLRSDQATLAGLTHSIGVLPILAWVEENDHIVRDSLTLDRVIEALHPHLGKMILKHWDFAPELTEVPRLYRRYKRDAEAVDYVDIVSTADLLLATNFCNDEDAFSSEQPNLPEHWDQPDCFARLNFAPDMSELERSELVDNLTNATSVFS